MQVYYHLSLIIVSETFFKNTLPSKKLNVVIDKFRGAMDKFRAEFGIFITTSSFTRYAIVASRAGTRVITLIDGDKLLNLVAKYKLYVTRKVITTY